ncbi:MAG: glycosyltransferase family 9 protein [Armatimonadota bacterium]
MGDPKNIACFHLNQVGDLLFSLPAICNLRLKYPDARITSIARPGCSDLLLLSGLVDNVLVRPRGFADTYFKFANHLRCEKFDLMLLFSTAEEAWFLAQLSGAHVKVGFTRFLNGFMLSEKVPWIPPPSTSNNLRLVESIGCPVIKTDYVGLIHPGETEQSAAREILRQAGLDDNSKYAVISSGTSTGREIKCWSDEKFAETADSIYQQHGMKSLVVGVNGGERICGLSSTAIDLTSKTSLPVLASILQDASVFIGVDSGVMHLAASVGAPVVGLFGPSNPEVTGPQGTGHKIIYIDLDCRPCLKKDCNIGRQCMEKISTDMVISAINEIINGKA